MIYPAPLLLRVLVAVLAMVLVGATSTRAEVVAEWDFRASERLTKARKPATKNVTIIHGASVNTGPAVGSGDVRIAQGFLHSPRSQVPSADASPTPSSNHGLKTESTFEKFFGDTPTDKSLGEGTLVMVVKPLGTTAAALNRKTLFAHELGQANSEMWLYYTPNASGPSELGWRVAGQYSSTRAQLTAKVPITLETGAWYVIVARWCAGAPNQLQVRKIASGSGFSGDDSELAITSTTNNGADSPLYVGVTDTSTEGSDMDIAFVQLANDRATSADDIYNQLTQTEPDDDEDLVPLGLGITLRADFSNGLDQAEVGTMTLANVSETGGTNITRAPGLMYEGELSLQSGAAIGEKPSQRLLCGAQTAIAPNFKTAGTLSFYWSPSFSSADSTGFPSGTPIEANPAYLWSTDSADDNMYFSGRWELGKLRAFFGDGVSSDLDMPLEANRWYLITVSWGEYAEGTVRGRVHWQKVRADWEENLPAPPSNQQVKDVHFDVTADKRGTIGLKPWSLAYDHLDWGDSQLCVGSTIRPATGGEPATGCRGTIDRVVYQDNYYSLSGAADGMYENTFPKFTANPLTTLAGAQEVQFPSTDVTFRGYPYNAIWRKEFSMTPHGTNTAVPGYRQLADPKRVDYALKPAADGQDAGVGLDGSSVLPRTFTLGGTIRLLYKPDQPTNGVAATLASSGDLASGQAGFVLKKLNQTVSFAMRSKVGEAIATHMVTLPANYFSDPKAWYYIGASWKTNTGGVNTGGIRVYVRKLETALPTVAGTTATVTGTAYNLLAGTNTVPEVRLGARASASPGATPVPENAKGAIDEVMFVDSATIWPQSTFDADFDKVRVAYSFYDFSRLADGKRVRYIPVDTVLGEGIKMANDMMPTALNAQGYQIPFEARKMMDFEPMEDWARKYFRDEIVKATNTTTWLVNTSGDASPADAWKVSLMVKWFDSDTTNLAKWSNNTPVTYHDAAVTIMNAMQTKFVWSGSTTTKKWIWGLLDAATASYTDLPVIPGDPNEDANRQRNMAANNPQLLMYDRFGSSMIAVGAKWGDTAKVDLGEKVMNTAFNARYNSAVYILPFQLEKGELIDEVPESDTDSLYFTVTAPVVAKEASNTTLKSILKNVSEGWSDRPWMEEWSHSRRKARLDSQPNTNDIVYGDAKWNIIRGLTVGYPTSVEPVKSSLLRKASMHIEFFRDNGRYGLYPATAKADKVKLRDFGTTDAWNDAAQEINKDDTDNNNIGRFSTAFVRDMIYAYNATGHQSFVNWAQELSEAMIKAGRYYTRAGEAINYFPRLATLRGVCRVKVSGSMGDWLEIKKVSGVVSKTVAKKPVTEYDEAVVYLAPGEYQIIAKRNTSSDSDTKNVSVAWPAAPLAEDPTTTGAAQTVTMNAPL